MEGGQVWIQSRLMGFERRLVGNLGSAKPPQAGPGWRRPSGRAGPSALRLPLLLSLAQAYGFSARSRRERAVQERGRAARLGG